MLSLQRIIYLLLFASLLIFNQVVNAKDTPTGDWFTLDDDTQEKRGIIRLWVKDGKLHGTVKKIWFRPGDYRYCEKCPGRFKDKKILGLTIIWGLTQDQTGEWTGGHVLDPERGQIYRMKMRLGPEGDKLYVRGYLGFSLFGRTQVWHRAA